MATGTTCTRRERVSWRGGALTARCVRVLCDLWLNEWSQGMTPLVVGQKIDNFVSTSLSSFLSTSPTISWLRLCLWPISKDVTLNLISCTVVSISWPYSIGILFPYVSKMILFRLLWQKSLNKEFLNVHTRFKNFSPSSVRDRSSPMTNSRRLTPLVLCIRRLKNVVPCEFCLPVSNT